MSNIWPSKEQFATLAAHTDEFETLTMLNLLRYRTEADYSANPNESPCSGKEAYARYAQQAGPLVKSYGGRFVFAGAAANTVIGPKDEQWDDVLLVEYPSVSAFMEMAGSEQYQAFAYHRAAALLDSRLVPIAAGKSNYLS